MKTQAKHYTKLPNQAVQCNLCPHNCIIQNGYYGFCRVRENVDGALYSNNYGLVSAIHIDPVEKKPLNRFFPGSDILSIGSVGCNMRCVFCQNCEISQADCSYPYTKEMSIESIIEMVKDSGTIGLAYTYNEPTIYYEFMYDLAVEVKKLSLKNVVVSNGFINPKPLESLIEYVDAFNIDLKSFEDSFYNKHTKSHIQPVKETLKSIITSGKQLEISNLVITDLNDNEKDFEEMCAWIASELSEDVPLHISRYFPRYKLSNEATSILTLKKFETIAKRYLKFVYLGNV